MKEPMLTIGKLAARTALSVDAIRYYEREGLISPATKTDAGYRLYHEDVVRRLQFIRHAQQCGFALAEIRDLLELQLEHTAASRAVLQNLSDKKLQIDDKVGCLETMSRALGILLEMASHPGSAMHRYRALAAFEAALGQGGAS